MRTWAWLATLAIGLGAADSAWAGGGRQVALVVGIDSYAKLLPDTRLIHAADDATAVAGALRAAGFQDVVLLVNGQATKSSIEAMIRDRFAPTLTSGDIFVVYFAGHGVGADLGLPTLLGFDSTIENGEKDGLELTTFAADLRAWSHAGATLIVTDAVHSQQASGVSLFGPAATQWPPMPPGFVVVSSSAAATPAKDGVFGQALISSLQTGDRSRDGVITAQELRVALTDALAPSGQVPAMNEGFNANLVVYRNNIPGAAPTAPGPEVLAPTAPLGVMQVAVTPVIPDKDVPAAKFVWLEGASPIVSCPKVEPVECLGSCYVRNFKAGVCGLQMFADGETVKGEVTVTDPGRYDCSRGMVGLTCKKVQ
jgi:hypothetical protein